MDLDEKERIFWEPWSLRLVIFWEAKKYLSGGSFARDPLSLFFQWGGGKGVSVTKPSPKVFGSKSSLVMQCTHWWHEKCYHYRWAFGYMISACCPACNPAATVPGKLQSHIWSYDKIILSVLLFTGHWNFILLLMTSQSCWGWCHHLTSEQRSKKKDKKGCQKCIGWHVQLSANYYNTQELW